MAPAPNRVSGRSAALLLALACVPAARAADWDITPRFYTGETYTDNVFLRPSGEGDFITEVTPGLSVRGKGSRLAMNLDYNMQNLVYATETDLDGMNHQLQGDTTAELYQDVLFFDARALMTQALIDPDGTISSSNLNGSGRSGGNRTDALNYGFSPYVRHHLGAWADAEARWRFDSLSYGGANARGGLFSDNDTDSTMLRVTSGRRFANLRWGLTRDVRTSDYASGRTNEFKTLSGDIGWRFSRKYQLDVTVGDESNDYGVGGRRSTEGLFWTLGGTWTPSQRTEVAFGFGDRYFGTTFYAKARHRMRRLTFTANYDEEPTNSASQFQNQSLVPLVDEFGQPVFDPEQSSRIPLGTDQGRLDDDVYINKRLDASVQYATARTSTSLRFYRADRQYETANRDEKNTGTTLFWSRALTMRLRSGASFSIQSQDNATTGIATDRYSVRPFLSYRLGPSLSATLEYQHYRSESDDPRNEYQENQLSAFLNVYL